MNPLRYGQLEIDLIAGELRDPGRVQSLTNLEVELLAYLARRVGQPVAREELRRAVWGHFGTTAGRPVDHCVKRLRGKLEVDPRDPRLLRTVRGKGYLLAPPDPERPGGGDLAQLEALPYGAASTQRALAERRRALFDELYQEPAPPRRLRLLAVLASDHEVVQRGLLRQELSMLGDEALSPEERATLAWLRLLCAEQRGLVEVEELLSEQHSDSLSLRLRQLAAGVAADALDVTSLERHLKAALALDPEPARRAVLASYAGDLARLRGELPEARDAYLEAAALARGVGNHQAEAMGHLNAAGVLALMGELPAAAVRTRRALSLARAACDPVQAALARANLATILALIGGWSEAALEAARAQVALERHRRLSRASRMRALRGLCVARAGALSEGEDLLRESLADARASGDQTTVSNNQGLLAAVLFLRGRSAEASQLVAELDHPEARALRAWAQDGSLGDPSSLALALLRS